MTDHEIDGLVATGEPGRRGARCRRSRSSAEELRLCEAILSEPRGHCAMACCPAA